MSRRPGRMMPRSSTAWGTRPSSSSPTRSPPSASAASPPGSSPTTCFQQASGFGRTWPGRFSAAARGRDVTRSARRMRTRQPAPRPRSLASPRSRECPPARHRRVHLHARPHHRPDGQRGASAACCSKGSRSAGSEITRSDSRPKFVRPHLPHRHPPLARARLGARPGWKDGRRMRGGGRMKEAAESLHPSSFCLHPSWRGCLQRPELRLAVRRVPQCVWPHFARHHYLAGGLAASATCYAAFWPELQARSGELGTRNDEDSQLRTPSSGAPHSRPIAFCAVVASLGWKQTKRITRLVTLPEFQGLGIASRLAETVAAHEQAKGHRVTITASHPAILAHCSRSPRWTYLGTKKTGSTRQRSASAIACSAGRAVASFEFLGERSA